MAVVEEGETKEGPTSARPTARVFAVRATEGHEREVADGIRERAQKEKMPLASALAPKGAKGYVLVEAEDFARLTNLVASVRHARGVLAPPAGGSDAAALDRPLVESIVEGRRTLDADGILEQLETAKRAPEAEAAPKPKKAKKTKEAGAAAPAAREAAPRPKRSSSELPALSKRSARLLNLAIVLPLAVLAVGLLVAPRQFYDGFLYPFFWRSIEADADNAGALLESYNVVDTLSYALILVPAVILIYRVLEKLRIKLDARFILMLTPFLILGGAARSLEDAGYFAKPLVYAFISPLIYLAEGLLVLFLVVASWWVARSARDRGMGWGTLAWSAAFAPGAAALAYLQFVDTRFVAAPIPAPILLSALACAYLAGLVLVTRPGGPRLEGFVFNAGVLLLGLTAYLIARWIALGGWFPSPALPAATRVAEVPGIIGLTCLTTGLTLLALYLASWKFKSLGQLLTPTNALVYFAQFLDGAATFWGIDMVAGYEEKHVLPSFLITATGTAAVMFPLKLLFVTGVLYLTDILYRKDLFDEKGEMTSFAALLKLTVAALGMGPGTRDMLRLAMGV